MKLLYYSTRKALSSNKQWHKFILDFNGFLTDTNAAERTPACGNVVTLTHTAHVRSQEQFRTTCLAFHHQLAVNGIQTSAHMGI